MSTSELEQVLPTLEPPAGGLSRLQASLDDNMRRRSRLFNWSLTGAGAATLAIAVALLILWPKQPARERSPKPSLASSYAGQSSFVAIELGLAHGPAPTSQIVQSHGDVIVVWATVEPVIESNHAQLEAVALPKQD